MTFTLAFYQALNNQFMLLHNDGNFIQARYIKVGNRETYISQT